VCEHVVSVVISKPIRLNAFDQIRYKKKSAGVWKLFSQQVSRSKIDDNFDSRNTFPLKYQRVLSVATRPSYKHKLQSCPSQNCVLLSLPQSSVNRFFKIRYS